MSIPIIGGKMDGQEAACRLPQIEEKGEKYILIEFSEVVGDVKVKHWFYMLTNDKSPAEARKIYDQRRKFAGGIHGPSQAK